ncbi:uncharacterized protein LOC134239087 [Saccostrea cucullata]|uniref:uncharacterized protein LOC134239087 n=1 Tax=Saccostrea cuccullata TaxID=36930 RepID=UPI002ED6508B
MSGFLFIIVVDWIMRNTNNKKRVIRWKFMSTLEDLDYADDFALLSSKHSDMQEKTRRLHAVAEYTGLKINVDKTKSMRINMKRKDAIRLNDKEVEEEEVETFLYLGASGKDRRNRGRCWEKARLSQDSLCIPCQGMEVSTIQHKDQT